MNNKKVLTKASASTRHIQQAAKAVTASSDSAKQFLKSTGIITSKGNLSPKYK